MTVGRGMGSINENLLDRYVPRMQHIVSFEHGYLVLSAKPRQNAFVRPCEAIGRVDDDELDALGDTELPQVVEILSPLL